MENLTYFLSIDCIALTILGSPISYLEVIATLFGLLSVFYAARGNILTWPTGIVNECGFFLLFYQVHLYADMFLQVVFFIVTLYGWHQWKLEKTEKCLNSLELKIFASLALITVMTSFVLGQIIIQLHNFQPSLFSTPAEHPFFDSYVAAASICAIILLARRTIESWIFWIAVDIICIGLFVSQEIYLVAVEYFIFLMMAIFGLYSWRKQFAS